MRLLLNSLLQYRKKAVSAFFAIAAIIGVFTFGLSQGQRTLDQKVETTIRETDARVTEILSQSAKTVETIRRETDARIAEIVSRSEKTLAESQQKFLLEIENNDKEYARDLAAARRESTEIATNQAAREYQADENQLKLLASLVAILNRPEVSETLTPSVISIVENVAGSIPEEILEDAKLALPQTVKIVRLPDCIAVGESLLVRKNDFFDICGKDFAIAITSITGNKPPIIQLTINGKNQALSAGNREKLNDVCWLAYLKTESVSDKITPLIRIRCDEDE